MSITSQTLSEIPTECEQTRAQLLIQDYVKLRVSMKRYKQDSENIIDSLLKENEALKQQCQRSKVKFESALKKLKLMESELETLKQLNHRTQQESKGIKGTQTRNISAKSKRGRSKRCHKNQVLPEKRKQVTRESCGSKRGRGSVAPYGRNMDILPKPTAKDERRCWLCNEYGHEKQDCQQKRNTSNSRSSRGQENRDKASHKFKNSHSQLRLLLKDIKSGT